MDLEEIVTKTINCGFQVHVGLGPGLLESAYQAVLVELLRQQGFFV
jgi:hypothetical protein